MGSGKLTLSQEFRLLENWLGIGVTLHTIHASRCVPVLSLSSGKFIKTLDLITDAAFEFNSLISRTDAAFCVVLRQSDIHTVTQDGMTKGFELPIGVVTRGTDLATGSTFDLFWYVDALEPFLNLIAVTSSIRTSKGWRHLVLRGVQRGNSGMRIAKSQWFDDSRDRGKQLKRRDIEKMQLWYDYCSSTLLDSSVHCRNGQ